MIAILLKTLPFFALIGLGFWAGHRRIFPPEAVGWLTKFVFYFALSAMLFRFAANLSLAEIFDLPFVLAYLSASLLLYAGVMALALWRGTPLEEATMEAQCAQSGNTGFLGVPMLVVLLGPAAAGPVLMVLTVDMVVFSSLFTLIITGARGGRIGLHTFGTLALGWLRNPMVVSIVLGLIWSGAALPLPGPVNEFLAILGGAATPGALFAIGASLAGRGAPRLGNAVWLSFAKLVLHPALVAVSALWLFRIDPQPAGVMIAAASLPVAGNLYILAQHYGVAPQRVSTAILISTAASILTVTAVIAWITG
ncbi:MAG: malate transporter [Rhodobacteraceae bacterium GWE1_64_9]|nr:MAG: malate transporter [Rhodobacteraceae bacterium GWE1_64_9]OHC48283.1 MAG: malate transporter [Rhodobacteraceae bacterium GWF1_65_7]HBD89367.1 malate transporter [Gemmobacter sp.]HBU13700.1 malate transporter [Gemmobacter sp.]